MLANDVVEFLPYVFQIFSQLLELRPAGDFSDVSDAVLLLCVYSSIAVLSILDANGLGKANRDGEENGVNHASVGGPERYRDCR